MKAITDVIKDKSMFNTDEQIYASNSKILAQILDELDLKFLYDPIMNQGQFETNENEQELNGKRLAEVQRLKLAYCLSESKSTADDCKSLIEEITDQKVNARELIIYPFSIQYKAPIVNNESLEKPLGPTEFSNNLSDLRT